MRTEETSFSPREERRALAVAAARSSDRELWDRVAVAPQKSRDAFGLVVLGVPLDGVEAKACTPERMRVVGALAMVFTRPTQRYPAGYPVADTVAACGKQHVFARGPQVKRAAMRCRARVCPACARAKATSDGNALARFVATRIAAGREVVFFTLTQVKRAREDESPREAMARIQAVYRAMFREGTRVGNWARALVVGGLRSVEVTWSPAGSKNRDGGRTKVSGYHVHLHGLWELAEGVDASEAMRWLRDAWVMLTPGASPLAQKCTLANDEKVRYVCKYVTKGIEDAARERDVVRELYAGMSGARLLQASGTWMGSKRDGRLGWRDIGDPPLPFAVEPWLVGPAVGWLVRLALPELRPEGVTTSVVFRERSTGEEFTRDAVEVFARLQAWERAQQDARAGPLPAD